MSASGDLLAKRRAELERRLAELTPEKRAQVEQARTSGAMPAQDGIAPRAAGASVPMSFAQELLWLLDRANPGMHGYNVPRSARLRGSLDVESLRRALSAIVDRHEVLRSTFDMVDGEPRQIVGAPYEVHVNQIDMRSRPTDSREDEAVALVQQLSRRSFDLTADPQLRVSLIRLADEDHVLLLESHHVASDAWSRNILLRELSALYEAYHAGGQGSLPPLAVQYGDFAIWQREALRGDKLERLLSYWREQLRDAPAVLDLPTDRARPVTPSFEGDTRSRMLSVGLLDQLRSLSRAHGTTLFMTLLAAFDVLLARWSGQDDVVVGSPIASRALEGTDAMIGYFANTLVLRTRVDDDPPFVDLLARVRETALGAYEHQDVPYEKLVLEMQRDRASGRGQLFQAMFTLQDAELRTMQLPGLAMEPFGASRGATKFDLSLFMHEQAGGLRAAIEFRTDLFDARTIERMLAQLETLLNGIVANPQERVSLLPLLPASERATLLEQWAQGPRQSLDSETLHGLITQQVERTPDAVAVESEGAAPELPLRRLTFRELDERAEAVGRYLTTKGVGPNVGVAICIERSPELVVAMLGVLKAGGYYLPLDPDYPADRLAFMLDDARVPVLLTAAALRDVVPRGLNGAGPIVIALDAEWDTIAAAPAPDSPTRAGGDDLAYVIYTSGSTGRPKGVMIPHRAVVNYLTWMRSDFPLDTHDAVLQKAPASFDACIWEFFLPLVSGARLVLARPGGHQDPAYLLSTLTRHDITLLQLVPSQLQMMLETPGVNAPDGLPRLRRLFLGGEALPSELLSRLADACPSLPVTNLYGPTEATVYATHWSVDLATWHGGIVPIGRPVSGASVYLLDARRQPVPIGVRGELCIGGVQVARGYLNRPELTAEKFIPDAFDASHSGARLYRTGDRARYRADGTLEYQGRIDTQVKLRGFRVELGEIENALALVSGVQSAVVLVREDTTGDQRLVAYCIAAPGADMERLSAIALRQQLKGTLPEFMVPSAFVWLDEWPMNANGKLDRKALPVPDADSAPAVEHVAPRTPTEQGLADIWADVLRREVGVRDDFFEIGGHSLLALRTLARVADRFGVRIPLRMLFDAPTIEQLALRVDAAAAQGRVKQASIPRRTVDTAPMSHAQELLWVLQRATPELTAYNVTEQWRITGALDTAALQRALDALVQRHEIFRTTFHQHDGAPVQRIGPAYAVSLAAIDLSHGEAPESAIQRRARELARTPFDLSRDPLLRALLTRTAPDTHVLTLGTHHVAFDGWSRGVLQRDLSALYEAEIRGAAPLLAPLPIRFADFAAWQRTTLTGDALESEITYWRDQLAGSGALDLPTDRPRPASPGFEGAKHTVVFSVELLRKLQAMAHAHDVTLYMLLLAAFQTLLHRYGGQEDVAVATVAAGRDQQVLEPLIGYFANTLVHRTSLADDPTVSDLLARVRAVQLEAAEHAAVPFEMLATARDGQPGISLPNVMFVLQNNAAATLTLGNAHLQPMGVESGTAKFDLFLSMGESVTGGLRAALQYRTELFDADTITRMLGHLETLLGAMVRDASQHVSQLPILTERERHQLLVDWNATGAEFPRSATMHGLVAAQAKATPDRIALADVSRAYTYDELTRRSGLLARALRARGVVPGTFVGVCMERSVEMIVALLAVLEAGGAYVPLDPAYPEERIAFMLDDTRAAVVLTETRVAKRLPTLRARAEAKSTQLMLLDDGWAVLLAAENPPPLDGAGASPNDLGYIIYTSGSTGRPKGVMIEHRSAVAFITWARSVFGGDELARVLASTSICFDLSIFEIFVPLATGGRVVVVSDAIALGTVPKEHAVTLINSVPSAATELVRLNAIPPSVRTINLAGEPLAQRLVDALYDIPTVERVYDLYGPSEDTTYSTFTLRTRGGKANIGRPIANTQCYVLDRRREPVPIGVPGELFIAGEGLARGYLHREELTAERFVENPFASGGTSPRMYRTGDLVRYLRDGRLEYFGRLDNQVKLRGFRIELGEIEAVIAGDGAVGQAVAVVCEVAPGDSRLIAYLAPKPGATVDLDRIRGTMRRSLPQYMLPSAIVTMDALPLTQNGKIDRKALPVPDLNSLAATIFVLPRSATEEKLAAVWCEVLKRTRVGVQDHFFELGGHSLMAMRVVSRVQEAFGVRLPLNAVLEWPTVEELAAKIDERIAAGDVDTSDAGITRVARVATRRPTSRPDALRFTKGREDA